VLGRGKRVRWPASRGRNRRAATLKDGGAAVAGGGHRLRSLLAAGQPALAPVLLAGAGLMIKTTILTFTFDPGLDVSRVLVGAE
jgi:hypothetical protein